MSHTVSPVRALVSVSDKNGIVAFMQFLATQGVEILSTGGTAKLLLTENVPVVEVGAYTGTHEMLDGRVKTLHPKVHGGILGMRHNPEHQQQMAANNIPPIDLVVVNLYPFEQTVKKGCSYEEAIENIDIGGPTMLRSAAKNHHDVIVIVDPADYQVVMDEMQNGGVTLQTRQKLARKVFLHTARYDAMISEYLNGQQGVEFPESYALSGLKLQDLRYGENPHQNAAFYRDNFTAEAGIGNAEQLHGKELSYNNIIDADAALELVKEFKSEIAVAIIKHTNPCGAATGSTVCEAYQKALTTDPVSAFGGVIATNSKVDKEAAAEMAKLFVEIIIAPEFTNCALEILTQKKNIRLLRTGALHTSIDKAKFVRKVTGGFLVQDRDLGMISSIAECKIVTNIAPTDEQLRALEFAWKVCKHVKSNAIVFANEGQLCAVGAGQMSRVDSSRIAVDKAQMPLAGTVLASDAFFPFRDGIDAAAAAGVKAIIQPGGSMRDQEVIDACNEHGIAMVFTGMRHFRH